MNKNILYINSNYVNYINKNFIIVAVNQKLNKRDEDSTSFQLCII